MLGWGDHMGVIFFYKDEPKKAYGCDCTSEYDKTGTGQRYNSDAALFCTKISDAYWYFDIPNTIENKHIGSFRILKLEKEYWCHQQMLICSADDFSGNQNCVTYSQWEVKDNETGIISEYSGGACVINNCGDEGSGSTPEPEPLSGDYYVFGAGGTNWVTGWTRSVEANKMTITDGVATKTFYNVSGQGLEFKIHKGETEYNNSLLLEEIPENNSHLIKRVWKNGTNIDFSISDINIAHKADVTVHFDGEHIWLTAVPSPETIAGSEWYIMGSGNVGTEHTLEWDKSKQKSRGNEHKMTIQDGVATITYTGVSGNISFKVFRGSDEYEINDFYYNASASSGIICTDQDGNDNINVNLNNQNISIHWDGTKIWTNLADNVPAVTYTVTLHPNNGGSNIVRTNVPEGSTTSAAELNLAAVTYGVGTATWYTNAECTTPFNSVTGDMDLYAKWGVSGNYYFVSCLQTANDDGGNNGNWSNNYGQQLSYSFIAPSGHMPFEIIKDKDWGQKINGGNYADMFDNSQSNVTISAAHGHMDFTLNEPKKVTVSYNGKVTIKTENYSFDNSKTWRIKTSWGNGGNAWNYNTIMTNNGTTNATAILRKVPVGQHSFVVTAKENDNDAMATVGTETFNALYVDTSNPSSGLTWNNTSARRDGSDNFNSTTPQTDNRWRNCSFTLNKESDICITFDGGKIRCDIVAPNIVTFKDGENTLSTQEVSSGNKATKPADPTKVGYTFVKWQLDGSDYDFSSAVNSNITLNAVWAYKGIESISLNESEHMTWVGNSDFTLTPTYSPSDLITKTVTWSSNNTSVATVSNGTVQAVSAGTATITCTITDMLGYQRSATCEVTVAACEMTTDNIYSMTVTSYNTSIGHDANLVGLWNESSDNDGPATLEKVKIEYKDNSGNNQAPIAVDADHRVKAISGLSDESDYWYRIPTGETIINGSHTYDVYYLKNVKTGEYMYVDKSTEYGHNGDYWHYWATRTSATNAETDIYKWFTAVNYNQGDHRNVIVCKDGFNNTYSGDGARSNIGLYRTDVNSSAEWSDPLIKCGQKVMNGYQNAHTGMVPSVSSENIPNPNYKASQMNTSYYRMNTGATVKANLGNALVKGAVITVRLYADAATSVQLTKADGTEVNTIPLAADTEFEYSYTVNNASPLLGESVFIIKAEDNHAGIASIKVTHTYVANPSNPELSWETDLNGGVTQSALGSTFRHVASSALSLGAIHYASSNEAVATVAADGTVTPHSAGTTTITATIAAEGCYDEASISYNITLTEASLQDLIDATPVDGTLTLTHDYSENAVINKAITLDAQGHTIDDLTVEYEGDLTLSSELTVRDFTIWAKAGNTEKAAASGQVRNASKLKVNGNAYFLYTVDPSGHVQYGWYDFTVPFPINIVSGIKGIQGGELKEDFRNGVDYAVMEYFGDKQAQGQYPYKKFSGVMQPNRLYTITLDDRYNYNTLRMQKTADGALVAGDEVKLNAYPEGDATNANWNGVGNGTLHHADAGISGDYIQVYQSGDRTFLTVDKNDYSLVVGSAFMVQQAGGTMMLNQATHGALLAPSRYQSTPATTIQIASEGKPFSDQLFITASETGGQTYTPGVDVAKAGELGSASVPQIWTNAYNSSLCVHEAQLINGKAQYKLSIYAPVAGTYTLTSKNIPADYSLYLTQNGMIVSELSDTYTLDLSNGITTEYGLLLAEIYNSPTGIDNTQTDKIQTTKIIRNGVLYILHNGKVYNAQGAMVK